MATIIYSMCGEGREHAIRSQTIVELLLPNHDIILLAARDNYQLLSERYKVHSQVDVHPSPGVFYTLRNENIDSIIGTVPHLLNRKGIVKQIESIVHERRPSLAITVSDHMLLRAAINCSVPCVSLDRQHFLTSFDIRSLPWRYQWRVLLLRFSLRLITRGQIGEAVSSFYHLPLTLNAKQVRQLGVLVRASVVAAKEKSHIRNHVLVYVRRHAPENLVQLLEKSGCRCIVYGMGQRPAYHNMEFQSFSEDRFVEDLARCDYLISDADSQVIGEAYYLGKPVLALPEPRNFEQQVNGWLIKQSKCGWTVEYDELTPHVLQQFALAVPVLRKNLQSYRLDGNKQFIKFIEDLLPLKNSRLVANANAQIELQQFGV